MQADECARGYDLTTTMTTIDGLHPHHAVSAPARTARVASVRARRLAYVPLCLVTISVVGLFGHARWSRASTLALQCDELPLLTRFTGLCGHATNEAEAQSFTPTLFTFRTGAIRSFRVLNGVFSVHTTTGFWTNLSLHLFGYGPAGIRAGPLLWSFVCMFAVGWAAWLATRHVASVCVAVAIVAASPFPIAYAAQARGYSEAMALTPLVLISWEYLRRQPDSWIRAALAMIATGLAALTVYTMWVFWVFPGLVLAVWLMPRGIECPTQRRTVRSVAVLMLVAMASFITVYSAVRYKALFFASDYGERFGGLSEALRWATSVASDFFALPVLCLLLAVVGLVAMWRSDLRWWCGIIAAGVAAPLALTLLNGSPGYTRNLCHFVPIVALLGGIGAGMLVVAAQRRFAPVMVGVTATVLLLVAATTGYGAVQQRATAILFPDWGALVKQLERTPETVGPRWLCPCLANHWQIDWYAERKQPGALMMVPLGGTIEVVMGAQIERTGPVVFRNNPYKGGIRPEPLPPFLLAVGSSQISAGISIRRWVATRTEPRRFENTVLPKPVFLAMSLKQKPGVGAWREFLTAGEAYEAGVVAFNLDAVSDGFVQTMIVPSDRVEAVIDSLTRFAGVDRSDIHVFGLAPLNMEDRS